MRKIVVCAFVSLDGVMQAPGGPEEDTSGGFDQGGWVFGYFDEAVAGFVGETFSTPYELLLGRKTYDIFAAYWPKMTDPKAPDFAIAEQFNRIAKHVVTHRPESLAWHGSDSLGVDPIARLRELKKKDGPMLLTQGSSEVVKMLFANDLVDELRLLAFPIVLGKGKRLFDADARPVGFRLEGSRTSPSGVVMSTWTRAGAPKRGSFADPR